MIPEYRNTGIPEYRNTGIPEYRNTGIPEYRNTEPGIQRYLPLFSAAGLCHQSEAPGNPLALFSRPIPDA
ncbi:MAG TPA: hypothetical protein ENK80_00325 [Rhodobacterales bacterium]|nr:hypothetical protein [Rhodobacterales bacterium]